MLRSSHPSNHVPSFVRLLLSALCLLLVAGPGCKKKGSGEEETLTIAIPVAVEVAGAVKARDGTATISVNGRTVGEGLALTMAESDSGAALSLALPEEVALDAAGVRGSPRRQASQVTFEVYVIDKSGTLILTATGVIDFSGSDVLILLDASGVVIADDDGDTIANFIELILGTDPQNALSKPTAEQVTQASSTLTDAFQGAISSGQTTTAGTTLVDPVTGAVITPPTVAAGSEPETSLQAKPPALTNSTSATFRFTTTGVSTQCNLDGAGFADCKSPSLHEGLPQGKHTFQARGVSADGVADSTPVSYTWTIDTAAPTTTVTGGPGAIVASNSASFTFSCSELNCGTNCALDGGVFSACTSPYALAGLADGSHTLQVKAIDPAGNESAIVAHTWTVDTTAPGSPDVAKVTVTMNAPGTSDQVSGSAGAVETSATVKIYEDALLTSKLAETTAQASGSFASVGIGDNKGDASDKIYVVAVDAAGNVSQALPLTNDKTAPAVTLSSLTPSSPGNSLLPTVSGTTEANIAVQIFDDGALIGTGSVGSGGSFSIVVSTAVSGNASNAITAKAADNAGNVSAVSNTLTYVHDNVVPSGGAVTDGGPTDVVAQNNTASMTAAWSGFADANGIASYEYNLSLSTSCGGETVGAVNVGAVTAKTTTGLTLVNSATYYNCVRARDTAANSGAWVASNGILVDTTAPGAPTGLATSPASPGSNSKPTVTGSAEANATIQIFDDGELIGTGSANAGGAFSVTVTTAVSLNASNAITAKATDAAGNVSNPSTGVTYVHDGTAPTFSGATTAGAVSSTQINLTWSAATDSVTSAANMVYQICWSTTYTGCASSFTATYTTSAGAVSYSATPLSVGTRYFFVIRARDEAGNVDTNVVEKSAYTHSTQSVVGMSSGGAGSDTYACALVGDGTVKCWGGNTYGQLGNDSTTASTTPVTVCASTGCGAGSLTGVIAVFAGRGDDAKETCALKHDGTVWCWGRNDQGQLGIGTSTGPSTCSTVACSKLPMQVQGSLTDAIAISVGGFYACALRVNGVAVCWGDNYYGQLGIGSTTDSYTPATVSGGFTSVAISTGTEHACAAVDGGGAKCWGRDDQGQLGQGNPSGNCNGQPCQMTPVAVCNVSDCGTSLSKVVAIAAANRYTCATLSDGGARCWGISNNGQLGNGGTSSSNTPAIVLGFGAGTGALGVATGDSGGADHACTVMSDGTERCWGLNYYGQLGNGNNTGPDDCAGNACGKSSGAVLTLTSVAGASNGSQHSFALMADGTLQSWGYDAGSGVLGRVSGSGWYQPGAVTVLEGPVGLISPSRALASGWGARPTRAQEPMTGGDGHACAVVTEGKVRCWGLGGNGQLGIGSTTNSSVPLNISTLANVLSVAGGGSHTCVLVAGGTVKCFGKNTNGQLGDNSTTEGTSPVAVCDVGTCATSLSKVAAIAAGGSHTCALIYDGTIKCWGLNTSGQLGDGTNNQSLTPVSVSVIATAVGLSAGDNHTCAVLADGTPRCWGYNASGQLGNGDNVNQNAPVTLFGSPTGVRAIAAGGDHACFATTASAAQCWGLNTDGQLGDGTNTTRNTPAAVSGANTVRSIVTGKNHSCTWYASGAAKCWGDNASGQLGDGSILDRNTAVSVTGLSGVVALTGGGDFTCASLSDGSAKCWGGNTSGQVGDGTTAMKLSATVVINLP
ncbi:MAG: hypothetical protein HYY13_13705 [Nitrospirae bacterium]|nr:hypothetical protein [Nitrospirota bacterium]